MVCGGGGRVCTLRGTENCKLVEGEGFAAVSTSDQLMKIEQWLFNNGSY